MTVKGSEQTEKSAYLFHFSVNQEEEVLKAAWYHTSQIVGEAVTF